MADKYSKIRVIIDPDSFSNETEVKESLKKLKKDLEDILKRNPLQAKISVTTDQEFDSVIAKVKEEISEISKQQVLQFSANDESLSKTIATIKTQLEELRHGSVIEIGVDNKQIVSTIDTMVSELNAQFEKLSGRDALISFENTLKTLESASRESQRITENVAASEQNIVNKARTATGNVSALYTALGSLRTAFSKYSNADTFKELEQGAENAAALIDKIATKVKAERVSLVGQLNTTETAKAIKQQMNVVSHELFTSYPNSRVSIVGTLDAVKTAAQISQVLDGALTTEMAKRNDSVTVGPNKLDIVTSKSSKAELGEYVTKFRQLKESFETLRDVNLSPLVTDWNTALGRLDISKQVNQIGRLADKLKDLAGAITKINSKTENMPWVGRISDTKAVLTTPVSSTSDSSSGKRDIVTEAANLSVKISAMQIEASVNEAIAGVDYNNINKIPVGVEIVGLVEAINQAVAGLQGNNTSPTNLPITFDATGLKAAINAEIGALNGKSGTLEKIKLEFDTSDLTRVVDEGTKAIEALKAATAAAAAGSGSGSGGTGGGGKKTPSADSIEMARFKIQQEVDAAKKLKKQFSNEGLDSMRVQKIDISSYKNLSDSITNVEKALRKAAKATTDKDKADILNSTTMKQAVIQLKQYEKETKALYKANSNFFNNSFDQNAIKKAFSTYQKALETAQKWGGTGFHYSKAGNIVGDADKNYPLSYIKLDGTATSKEQLYLGIGAQLEAQAQQVKNILDKIQTAWSNSNTPKKEIADLNRQLETQIQELLRIKNIADTLEEVKFGDISNPDFIQNYSVAFQKLQNQFAAFEGYQSDQQFADLKIDVGAYAQKLSDAYEDFQRLKNEMGTLSGEEAQNLAHGIATSVAELDEFVVKTKAARAGIAAGVKEQNKVQQEQARINDYVEKYERRLKRFPALWAEIKKIQDDAANGIDSEALKRSIDTVMMNARDLGVENENFFTKVWERVGFNFRSMIASQGTMLLLSSFRDLYNNVKELDAAMTELKKVTDGTANTYIRFLDNASERAQKLGASLVDVVSATSDFARLGSIRSPFVATQR